MGPLFRCELMRLARQGRSIFLRVAYALTLFAALTVTYVANFSIDGLLAAPLTSPGSLSARHLTALAESFVYSILFIQTAAVLLLTPAYLAGAVAEEKERRTLELLFTTHVSDAEIVLGKLAGRVAHLATILLACISHQTIKPERTSRGK